MKKNTFLLFLIILLALFLRLYRIDSVPPSASLDEVSIGWNAYSILQTGGDGYGYKFPILLRAYDDWRPALYIYSVIPFVKIFGLNIFSVRLPSVIFSVFTVFITYLLAKKLFIKNKYNEHIGLLSALFLGLSPWHIYISRLGHEANPGLFFAVLGIYLFIYFIRSCKNWTLPLSITSFVLSLYSYQSEKLFIPLITLALFVIFYKEMFKFKKLFIFSLFLGFVIFLPLFKVTLSPEALVRLKATSAFDTNQSIYYQNFSQLQKDKKNGNLLGQLIHQRRSAHLYVFISQYISHFNPNWLFSNSSDESFKAPGIGILSLWIAPFIFIGFYFLFRKELDKKIRFLIILWILISFIPSAIATQAPHAMRSYNLLPAPQILAAFGLVKITEAVNKLLIRKILYIGTSIVIIFFGLYFFKQYFIVFPKEQSSSFQYALKEAIEYVNLNKGKYDKIVFSNRDNLYQSYMFYLFYSKYDPRLYQRQGGTISGGFAEKHKFGKFLFEPIDNLDKYPKRTLLIRNIKRSINGKLKILKIIRSLDGSDTIGIMET